MESPLFETDLFTGLEPGIPGGETPPFTAGGTPAATDVGFMESWGAAVSGLLIFLGSGLGGLARWWLAGWIGTKAGHTFPWGTLVVNVSGSFLIGVFATLTGPEGRWVAPLMLRQFFMLGVCGGYTTFSSFSLQTLQLMEEGQWMRALANTVASVVLCLGAVGLGHLLALGLNPPKGHG